MRLWHITAHGRERVRRETVIKGETVKLGIDWNGYLGWRSSATVSSSAWATEDGNITLSSATNSGGVTGTTVAASSVGEAIVKNTATLSNGEILVRKFRLSVVDPDVERLEDYQG